MRKQWLFSLAIFTLVLLGVRVATQTRKEPIPTGEIPFGIASLPGSEYQTPFPLSQGSYWVYQGLTQWVNANSGEVSEKNLTWKMEVVETIERGHLKVAVIKGHPADLAWYREGKERGDYLIVEVHPGKFYLVSGDRAPEVLSRVKNEADFLVNLVEESELFLDWPLIPGKVFGPAEQLTRLDGGYRWNVEESKAVKLKLKGISSGESHRQYRLSFRTAPDIISMEFIPGVGISGYEYVHRGSVSETHLKLIEYHSRMEGSKSAFLGGSLGQRSRSLD